MQQGPAGRHRQREHGAGGVRRRGCPQPPTGDLTPAPADQEHDGREHADVGHVLLHQQGGDRGRAGEPGCQRGAAFAPLVDGRDHRRDTGDNERGGEQLAVDLEAAHERTHAQARGQRRRPRGGPVTGDGPRDVGATEDHDHRGQATHQSERDGASEVGGDAEDGDEERGTVHPVAAVERGATRLPLLAHEEEAGLVRCERAVQEREPGDHRDGGGRRDDQAAERDGRPPGRRGRSRRAPRGRPRRSGNTGRHAPRLRRGT